METLSVESLRPGQSFTGDVMIDSSFLLLPNQAELTDGMISALKEWGFTSVQCDGDLSLDNLAPGEGSGNNNDTEDENSEQKGKIGDSVRKIIENARKNSLGNSDATRMEMVHEVYNEYMNYIESVFTHYATHKEIDRDELATTVQELCMFIKEHKRYILRVNPSAESIKKNYLITSAMRTAVLSIALGQQIHLPLSKMIDLGMASILHDIGMLRLPPQLYMQNKKLSSVERSQVSKHTVYGYTIIKDLGFSLPIQLGVLEHHEKENGNGYPRKLTGDQISAIGKILAVTTTYDAISSPRSYKSDRSTFDALLEMLTDKAHNFDPAVIKALLLTVSLYPIGTYVYLTNRKAAEVIDSNPENPKFPIVQLLTERDKDGALKTLETGKDGVTILRVLSANEKADLLKALKEQEEGSEKSETEAASQSAKEAKPSAGGASQSSEGAAKQPANVASPAADTTKTSAEVASPVADTTKTSVGEASPVADATKTSVGEASPTADTTKTSAEVASPAAKATTKAEANQEKVPAPQAAASSETASKNEIEDVDISFFS